MNRIKLRTELLLVIFSIFILNYLAMTFHWYTSIWFSDIILHIMGGFWLGILYLYFMHTENPSVRYILYLLSFVLLIGLSWEVFEIIINKLITFRDFNYQDSISDVFFDLAGGLFSVLYFKRNIMNGALSEV